MKKIIFIFFIFMFLIPFNIYAFNSIRTDKNIPSLLGKTIFIENSEENSKSGVIEIANTTEDLPQYIIDSSNLVIDLNYPVNIGDSFKLKLNNADWFFRMNTLDLNNESLENQIDFSNSYLEVEFDSENIDSQEILENKQTQEVFLNENGFEEREIGSTNLNLENEVDLETQNNSGNISFENINSEEIEVDSSDLGLGNEVDSSNLNLGNEIDSQVEFDSETQNNPENISLKNINSEEIEIDSSNSGSGNEIDSTNLNLGNEIDSQVEFDSETQNNSGNISFENINSEENEVDFSNSGSENQVDSETQNNSENISLKNINSEETEIDFSNSGSENQVDSETQNNPENISLKNINSGEIEVDSETQNNSENISLKNINSEETEIDFSNSSSENQVNSETQNNPENISFKNINSEETEIDSSNSNSENQVDSETQNNPENISLKNINSEETEIDFSNSSSENQVNSETQNNPENISLKNINSGEIEIDSINSNLGNEIDSTNSDLENEIDSSNSDLENQFDSQFEINSETQKKPENISLQEISQTPQTQEVFLNENNFEQSKFDSSNLDLENQFDSEVKLDSATETNPENIELKTNSEIIKTRNTTSTLINENLKKIADNLFYLKNSQKYFETSPEYKNILESVETFLDFPIDNTNFENINILENIIKKNLNINKEDLYLNKFINPNEENEIEESLVQKKSIEEIPIDSNKILGNFPVSTYDMKKGFWSKEKNIYLRTNSNDENEILYRLEVSKEDPTIATIFIEENTSNNKKIIIPLITLTNSLEDGFVEILDSNITSVENNIIRISEQQEQSIQVSSKSNIDAKFFFPIKQILITENYPSTIKSGKLILTAPYGFTFADPILSIEKKFADQEIDFVYPRLIADSGLEFVNGQDILTNEFGEYMYLDTEKSNEKGKRLIIDLPEIKPTTTLNGSIYIEGLILQASESANYESVNIGIMSENLKIPETKIKIGNRINWGIDFYAKEDYSDFTLVSGKFEDNKNKQSFDSDHKTASVRFAEKVSSSWWSQRQTEFILNNLDNTAKFIQVKMYNCENFNSNDKNINFDRIILPNQTKDKYINLESNKLILTDIEVIQDQKASFDLDIWVSIKASYEGDIILSTKGSDELSSLANVKIAKAIKPVSIQSEISDLKTGYQWQDISDIIISENSTRLFSRNSEIEIYIGTEDSEEKSISISPDFKIEIINDSDLIISEPFISENHIRFTINKESYNKPAKIKISNLHAKIDRTVVDTNDKPFKIIVSGSAIVKNYYLDNNTDSIDNYGAFFDEKGVGADYINIETLPEKKSFPLKTEAQLTIGSKIIILGKENQNPQQSILNASPYISETNTTMFPVRGISNIFGVEEEEIVWDDETKTVTIISGDLILKFTSGSSKVMINGLTTTMFNENQQEVFAQLKQNQIFIPLRNLCNILGASIIWDDSTQNIRVF